MRARNREINIFNMSLLDILCGALGAFCFMMIVLLPYYKPGTGADAKAQQELEETLKDIDKLKEKLKDAELAKELAELIEKLKAQIKELEGRVNSLVAQNQQLQGQVSSLEARNKQLEDERKQLEDKISRLEFREPFIVSVSLSSTLPLGQRGSIDLYVWEDAAAQGGKKRQPAFDPAKPGGVFWSGEQTYGISGSKPSATWIVRDVPAGITWKIYVKLSLTINDLDPAKNKPIPISQPIPIFAGVSSADGFVTLPDFSLTAEHPWALAGFVIADKSDNKKVTVRGATAAEREAEWKALDKKPPPPPGGTK